MSLLDSCRGLYMQNFPPVSWLKSGKDCFAIACMRGSREVERFRHGDLLSRFGTDIPKIQALLVDGVIGFLHNVLFLLLCAAILIFLSPILALWSYLGLGRRPGHNDGFSCFY